jgi:L,D-transpeptidase YcbB
MAAAVRRAAPALALLICVAAIPAARAAEPLREALRERIESLRAAGDAQIGAGSSAARTLVASLYERRGFSPLWADVQRARSLQSALEASSTHGLDPRDYHLDALARLQIPVVAGAERDRALAQRELLLTDALVRLAYHLYFGKADPRALSGGWNFARTLDGLDPLTALTALVEAPDPAAALENLAPRLPMYRDLRSALEQLRSIERVGGWRTIAPGPKLELGASGAPVIQLRDRLRASGDLAADADDPIRFDAALEAALRRFQARHGLEPDGVAGKSTIAALNVSVAERIAQVRANLERLRWVARELTGDFLLVDIAGFTARLWLNERLAWSSRVVVGRPYRTTPQFRARMKYLVLNPDWNVPPTILREDVLPKVTRDPGYLPRQNMRVVTAAGQVVDAGSIDWAKYQREPRAFPFQIVQAPGRENPLGTVKFMFPNEHSVYLHDTPSRALFQRQVRAFSSGCIRIERPFELAMLLLDDPQRWSDERLREAIATGRMQTIPVRRTVPVMLLYFTASVATDGALQFRPDLYARDGAVIRALAAPFRFAPVDRGGRA